MAILYGSSTVVNYFGTFNLPGTFTVTAILRERRDDALGAELLRTATVLVIKKLEGVHVLQEGFTAKMEANITLSAHSGKQ
ncbi:unnamed protein product [Dibothriocephalus latus]|uniref:Uncharacterized protein n=1 Tax=Dibothriocephalus latus TaxID=60516 RepID=A0A3P7NSI7_DIBLA|nr:unnamed protein product [Dibothriocephalus latus]